MPEDIKKDVIAAIGNTPLVRLRRASEMTGCEILGKAEFMNPGGSVKDRPAYNIILEAEASGELRPGQTIVEGTAGNTGIGLTTVGASRGYPIVIVIPETQAPEKIQRDPFGREDRARATADFEHRGAARDDRAVSLHEDGIIGSPTIACHMTVISHIVSNFLVVTPPRSLACRA